MHAIKPCLAGLLLVLGAPALCGSARSRWDIAPVFKIGLPPMPVVVQPVIAGLEVPPRVSRPFRCGCMSGHGFGYRVAGPGKPPRESRLADSVAVIGAAYLQSRSVKAALLDPEFPAADYREGYFGAWVQDGLLVKERAEFTDEATLRRVFALLVEAIGEFDEEAAWWTREMGSERSQAAFRRDTGFVPELTFEFVGEVPLRIELNAAQRRMLIQAGDRRDIYTLDRWTAAALGNLLTPP